MSYFPHQEEEELDNPRINRFERDYPVSKSRNYSPEDKDRITERIIRYFEDPKEAKALAEIRRISDRAKKQSSKNIRKNFIDYSNNKDLQNNTELNRLMYKNEGKDHEIEEPNNQKKPFARRKFKFSTQRYAPKIENMSLIDEIKLKQNKNNNKNNKDKENYIKNNEEIVNKRHRHDRKIKFVDENINNNKNDDNIDYKNEKNKENNNYEKKANNSKKFSHISNLKKSRNFYSNRRKNDRFTNENNTYNNDNVIKLEEIKGSFNNIPEEYKLKNNATVENLDNKEKIIINEYHNKDKKKTKNYKTEYVWDININRLVEKRIYLDNNENEKNPNNNNNFSNNNNKNKSFNDKNDNINNNDYNKIEKDFKPKKEEKEEKIKLDMKNKDRNNRYKNNEDEKNNDDKIVIRKRFGNLSVLKKDIKNKNNNIEKEKEKNNSQDPNKTKELNKNNSFYNQYRYNKSESKEKKPNDEENIIKKEPNNIKIKNKDKNKEPIFEDINIDIKPNKKIYKKRQFLTKRSKKEDENEKNDKKNLRDSNNNTEKKPNKLPHYKSTEPRMKEKYTKKIISKEKKPKDEIVLPKEKIEKIPMKDSDEKDETIHHKKYEKKYIKFGDERLDKEEEDLKNEKVFEKIEGKVSILNPYKKYNRNSLRIKKFFDSINDYDNNYNRNNTYRNYITSRRKGNDNQVYLSQMYSIDDLERFRNSNTYLNSNDLIDIYDNSNEEINDFKNNIFPNTISIGDFNKKKIPYYKKNIHIGDLSKGRFITDDIHKKSSKKIKKYEKKKLFD